MEPRQLEQLVLNLKAKFEKVFPNDVVINEFARMANQFYDDIRKNKPFKITSPQIMSRVLRAFPTMPANKIDDWLLEHHIGSEQALIDFLDLEEKNRTNKPLVKDEGS